MTMARSRKRRIMERDAMRCRYCDIVTIPRIGHLDHRINTVSIDHFMPLSLGGSNDDSNLVIACLGCNRAKGNQHPDVFMLGLRIRAFGDMISEAHLFPNPHYDRAKATFDRLAA